jgi:DNA transposition AAA+ family ATPase
MTETNRTLTATLPTADRLRIPRETIARVAAALPVDQGEALLWLADHAARNNHSLEELAAQLRQENGKPYSRDSLYQTLTGRRSETGASLAPITAAIQTLRRLVETRLGTGRAPFIETPLSRRIWKICEAALAFQRLAFIYGASQIGKSTALQAWVAGQPTGQAHYLRMPTRGGLGDTLRRLAVALHIPSSLKLVELKERILGAVDERMILVIDQAHECFSSPYGERGSDTLLFLMELHDLTRCAILLAGTSRFEHGMIEGRHAETMKQLILRGLPSPLRLPAKPDTKSLAAFAAHYGLAPAEGEALTLQTNTIRDHDLGIWLTLLQAGGRIAAKAGEPMTWNHVITADLAFRSIG